MSPTSVHTNLANNIFWNNGVADLYIANASHPTLLNNDIGIEGGTLPSAASANNVSIDPLFVSSALRNYRLRATSPARDVGDNSPPGTVRNYDLDGTVRIDGAKVDMGAYEFHNMIFDDGFDKGN
jgi:hypothetical protein